MNRVAILGSGDLGVQLAHHINSDSDHQVIGFFDDLRESGSQVDGIPVLGSLRSVRKQYAAGEFDSVLVGIGYRHLVLRQKLYEELSPHVPFATFIHPSAIVDPTCTIGRGVVIYSGCVIDMHSEICPNTLLNVGCVIAHHSRIGMGCFLSPSVSVAGFVQVQSGVTLGIGTTIIDNINIHAGVRTGAGAVVTSNLVTPGLYVGIPARWKKG